MLLRVLIVSCSGFDAVEDDVGNAKHSKHLYQGADLTPSDYAWVTARIQDVADMCCNGRYIEWAHFHYSKLCACSILYPMLCHGHLKVVLARRLHRQALIESIAICDVYWAYAVSAIMCATVPQVYLRRREAASACFSLSLSCVD